MRKLATLLILALVILTLYLLASTASADSTIRAVPTSAPEDGGKIFLPLVIKSAPTLGVYVTSSGEIPYLLYRGKISSGIRWDHVESKRGVYDWSKYDPLFNSLNRIDVIQIKNTPAWARPNGGSDPVCVPPMSVHRDKFAAFAIAVIDRYNPEAILLWNEPDASGLPEHVGCFPNGYSYGSFVRSVYPTIKAARPNVIVGAGETAGSNTPFTNAFYTNAQDNFDVVTYHAYSAPTWNNFSIFQAWANYHNGKTNKPVWLTETSYRCNVYPAWCYGTFEQDQANFLRKLVSELRGVDRITWYHVKSDGWAQVGLVRIDGTKKPAWYVYQSIVGGNPYP